MATPVSKILHDIENLPQYEKLDLLEKMIHSLKQEQKNKNYFDPNELYGLGSGIWDIDAQDFVNQSRNERE